MPVAHQRSRSPVASLPRPAVRLAVLGGALLVLAPISGFAADLPVKLSGAMVEGGEVSARRISPDGSTVVYLADQDVDGMNELYSVPITGGTPVKLNPPLIANGDVSADFAITPDSRRVVFLADDRREGASELFSAPVAGGAATRLNRAIPTGGGLFGFDLSPDSRTVVYVGEQYTDAVVELYSVPVSGGTITKLNRPLGGGRNILNRLFITPDSSRAVYLADQDTNGVNELYSVPIGGGNVTKLNGPLPSGGGVGLFGIGLSPDGSTVVYTADQITNNVHELFSVPVAGGTSIRLNAPLVSGGAVFGFRFAPDSSTVVYLGDQDVDDLDELYAVSSSGGAVTKLSNPAFGTLFFHEISADGARVVYMTNEGVDELYSAPIGGGPVVKLNAPLAVDETVIFFDLSHAGDFVLYATVPLQGDEPPANGLFRVPIQGGAVVTLVDGFAPNSGLVDVEISPNDALVAFRADIDSTGVTELYQIPARGGPVDRLNAPLVVGGSVLDRRFSPDSAALVYIADQDTDEVDELYAVATILPAELFADGFED
jgi:Tol biopolymer transport system component